MTNFIFGIIVGIVGIIVSGCIIIIRIIVKEE